MSAPVLAAIFLLVGVAVGAVHAGLLWRLVMLFAGAPEGGVALVLNVARFGLVIAVFWLVAQLGATALIATVIGFTLAVIGARFVVGREADA